MKLIDLIKERTVWKSAEYEEVNSALITIEENLFIFGHAKQEIQDAINTIRHYVDDMGTMVIEKQI